MRSALLRATWCLSWGDQGAGFTECENVCVRHKNGNTDRGGERGAVGKGQAAERDCHTKTSAAGGLPRVGRGLNRRHKLGSHSRRLHRSASLCSKGELASRQHKGLLFSLFALGQAFPACS